MVIVSVLFSVGVWYLLSFLDTHSTTSVLSMKQKIYVLAKETVLCQKVIKAEMLLTGACKFPSWASRLIRTKSKTCYARKTLPTRTTSGTRHSG
jgi:hypothetical protein